MIFPFLEGNRNFKYSLSHAFFKDFAHAVISCKELDSSEVKPFKKWELIEICEFRKKDWLKEDGTINSDLKTRFKDLGKNVTLLIHCCAAVNFELFMADQQC